MTVRNKKLILDGILTVALCTMYSKNLFGIHYHEIVGLAVLLPILVHIFINLRMVRAMAKNFKRVPVNVRVCLIVDVLLFVSFAWIGISGVLISRTILTGISASAVLAKMTHMLVGELSVILLGVHIGLHICRKELRTGLAVALTVVALVGGIYGFGKTGMMPMGAMPIPSESNHRFEGGENGMEQFPGHGMNGAERPEGFEPGQGKGYGNGPRNGMGNGMHGGVDTSPLQKLLIVAQFFGKLLSCAMVTYWVVILNKKRKQRKPPQQESPRLNG